MTSLLTLLVATFVAPASALEFGDLGRGLESRARHVELGGHLRMRGLSVADDLRRDLRLRADLSAVAPTPVVSGVAVRTRFDVDPQGAAVRRVWGEALTPFGVLAAGRMGSHWGLGLVANGGDCPDCDGVDAVDRIAIVTPLVGHLWALAYDLHDDGDTRAVTLASLRFGDPDLAYGLLGSHLWQDTDGGLPRGLDAWLVDGYLRWRRGWLSAEVEAAWRTAQVEQPSVLPGVLMVDSGTADQRAVAVRIEAGTESLGAGVAGGWASGDDDPDDLRLDAFRAHPDFHVDRLVFRESIGAFAAAWFARPYVRGRLARFGAGALLAEVGATVSRAVAGGRAPHGVEPGVSFRYLSRDGFEAAAQLAALFPAGGGERREAVYGRLGYGF